MEWKIGRKYGEERRLMFGTWSLWEKESGGWGGLTGLWGGLILYSNNFKKKLHMYESFTDKVTRVYN